VVVHSSAQDQRRQPRWARALEASWRTRETLVGQAATQEYVGQAAAEATAATRRALQSAYRQVAVVAEARPQDGPGRPSHQQPRGIQARRYGLQVTRPARAEVIARKPQETGGFVLLTTGPAAGEMAHRAGDVRRASKEPQGIEQPFGCLKDPLLVNRLSLKTPERLEALGVVVLLARLLWRCMARARRLHVERTGNAWPGWDKPATTRPPAFMRLTTFTAVMGLKVGPQRQLAQALSAVQQPYRAARGVQTACVTGASGG
jgi:hypothetical protein